jgi:hypothetical protein
MALGNNLRSVAVPLSSPQWEKTGFKICVGGIRLNTKGKRNPFMLEERENPRDGIINHSKMLKLKSGHVVHQS